MGILYDNVTDEDWQKFAEVIGRQEILHLRLRFCHYDATTHRIVIVELPGHRHEKVYSWFDRQFGRQGHDDSLDGTGSATAEYIHKEADGSWTPNGRGGGGGDGGGAPMDKRGNPYPTVVLEVGYNQSLDDLRYDALQWLSEPSTVQIVIIVKMWDRKRTPPAKPTAISSPRWTGFGLAPAYLF